MIDSVTTQRRSSTTAQQTRVGHRRKVSVPARLTWRDASGTLRFVSVLMRDVSEVDAFVECQVPASIPLYRLVHFQVERPSRDGQDLPASLQTPAAQTPTATQATPAAPRAAASGRGALTGPALAPVDTAPEEAPF